jgi:periplasmic divalent cation tolerance protein
MTTIANDRAEAFAELLIREKRAACVQILPGAKSFYRWKGKLCVDKESALFIKTTPEKLIELKAFFAANHPYELPEFLAFDAAASEAYLAWAQENL